jgi:hypothetical protein
MDHAQEEYQKRGWLIDRRQGHAAPSGAHNLHDARRADLTAQQNADVSDRRPRRKRTCSTAGLLYFVLNRSGPMAASQLLRRGGWALRGQLFQVHDCS